MPNGHETGGDPEVIRLRERLAEIDQARMDEQEEGAEEEFNELQEQYRLLTGDYYDLPKDRDI